jgi:imidazolonepropionase-like amidohydrolase
VKKASGGESVNSGTGAVVDGDETIMQKLLAKKVFMALGTDLEVKTLGGLELYSRIPGHIWRTG